MILYRINLSNGYFDGTLEYPDDPEEIMGIPYGTARKATPDIPEGHYAVWNGSGWDLTSSPPPPYVEPEIRLRVDAFYDRFGDTKYDILFSTDPEVQALVQKTREYSYINPKHPDVIAGVEFLLSKGFVFDTDRVLNTVLSPGEEYTS